MNRATVWSLQKKERDSCDIYFFSERGEGGAKSTSKVKCVLFYIKTAGMPKRINALKNVKQTIHFSKKQWWSRPIQTSPIQWPHLWNYCFWPDSQRVKYYHFQSSQASTPLPEILQFRFSKLSLRWIFNISMTIDTTPTSQRLVEQTKGQWNDILINQNKTKVLCTLWPIFISEVRLEILIFENGKPSLRLISPRGPTLETPQTHHSFVSNKIFTIAGMMERTHKLRIIICWASLNKLEEKN